MMRWMMMGLIVVFWTMFLPGCKDAVQNENVKINEHRSIENKGIWILSSPDFKNGDMIPRRFSCDGENIAPTLRWSEVSPAGVKSLALVCEDPDAPKGLWVHWLVTQIPVNCTGISENSALPKGSVEVKNSFGRTTYGGPCPPSGVHRYYFKLYALDTDQAESVTLENYHEFFASHTVMQTELMGRYARRIK